MKKIVLLVYLLTLSIFDRREKRVPLYLLAGGVVFAVGEGLINCARAPDGFAVNAVKLFCGLLPGLFLLLAAWLTQKIGWGDGMALLTVGAVAGCREAAALLCFSMLAAAVFSVVLLLLRRADRHTTLPYLPFLTAVYLAGLF